MSATAAPVLCSTIFTPADPVVSGKMRNCAGSTTTLPTKIGNGNYRITMPQAIDLQNVSIRPRAYEAAGVTLNVTVVPTVAGDVTTFNIFIKTDAGVANDAALNVEVTVFQLPLM